MPILQDIQSRIVNLFSAKGNKPDREPYEYGASYFIDESWGSAGLSADSIKSSKAFKYATDRAFKEVGARVVTQIPNFGMYKNIYYAIPEVQSVVTKLVDRLLSNGTDLIDTEGNQNDTLQAYLEKTYNLKYIARQLAIQKLIYNNALIFTTGYKQDNISVLDGFVVPPMSECQIFLCEKSSLKMKSFYWVNPNLGSKFIQDDFYFNKGESVGNVFFGDSPLMSLELSAGIINSDAKNYNEYFENGSFPGLMFLFDDQISDAQKQAIKAGLDQWKNSNSRYRAGLFDNMKGSKIEQRKPEIGVLDVAQREYIWKTIINSYHIPSDFVLRQGGLGAGEQKTMLDNLKYDALIPIANFVEEMINNFVLNKIFKYDAKAKDLNKENKFYNYKFNEINTETQIEKSQRLLMEVNQAQRPLKDYYTEMYPNMLNKELYAHWDTYLTHKDIIIRSIGKTVETKLENGKVVEESTTVTKDKQDLKLENDKQDEVINIDPVNQSTKAKSNLGCVMAVLDPTKFKSLTDQIDKEDLYIDKTDPVKTGSLKEFHITLLYGIDPSVLLSSVKEIMARIPDFPNYDGSSIDNIVLQSKPTIEKINAFYPVGKDYEVLVLEVEAKSLTTANLYLTELPFENDYPEYRPHITLAYLKKGTVKKYLDLPVNIRDLEITEIIFSSPITKDKNTVIASREALANQSSKAVKTNPITVGFSFKALVQNMPLDTAELEKKKIAGQTKNRVKFFSQKAVFDGQEISPIPALKNKQEFKEIQTLLEKRLYKQYADVILPILTKQESQTSKAELSEEDLGDLEQEVEKETDDLNLTAILAALYIIAMFGRENAFRYVKEGGQKELTPDERVLIDQQIKSYIANRIGYETGKKVLAPIENRLQTLMQGDLKQYDFTDFDLNKTSKIEITSIIKQAINNKLSKSQVLDLIKKNTLTRAELITTQEVNTIFGLTEQLVYDVRKPVTKTKLPTKSKDPREIHSRLNFQTIPFDQFWSEGSFSFPNPFYFNCQCSQKVTYQSIK
jgi:2'-5' RNA ligase